MRCILAFTALAAPLLAGPIAAEPSAPPQHEAAIPFADQGIRDWKVGDATTLYLQGRDRKWYRATVFSNCRNLGFATRIGFDVGPSGVFDRSSYILVEGQRCPLRSVVESGPPPKSAR